jgi:hypothetical protein
MLTQKQLWRKTKASNRSNSHLSVLFKTPSFICFKKKKSFIVVDNSVNRSIKSLTDSSEQSISSSRTLKSSLSSSYLRGLGERKPVDNRKLRFSSTVKVCLILSRPELKMYFDDLYWRGDICNSFKEEALAELKLFMAQNKCTAKQAIFRLYQPSSLSESDISQPNSQPCSPSTNLPDNEMTSLKDSLKIGGKTDVEMIGEGVSQLHVKGGEGATGMWTITWRKESGNETKSSFGSFLFSLI